MKNIINKLLSYFKKDTFIFTYEVLKKDNKKISFIIDNIVDFNNHMELVLKDNDFILDKEYKHILKISEDKIKTFRLIYWVTNKGNILTNPDSEIKRFLSLTDEMLKKFYILKQYKSDDNSYKFNIRLIQPYIINIELIKGVLLEIKNNNIKK